MNDFRWNGFSDIWQWKPFDFIRSEKAQSELLAVRCGLDVHNCSRPPPGSTSSRVRRGAGGAGAVRGGEACGGTGQRTWLWAAFVSAPE
jgi:hypothetical protein